MSHGAFEGETLERAGYQQPHRDRDSQGQQREGDAEAARIYAESYTADPSFYEFVRTLESYRKSIDEGTTLVLSPGSEFYQFLESVSGNRAR